MVDVLIVDDRLDGLMALEVALKLANVNLVKASSGREALSLLSSHDFAVILLDVQMPEMDGFETATLIRQQNSFQSTPIIFVTAINKDDAYVYRGYDLGAVDYIFKPFDPHVLRSKVGVFVDLHLKSQRLKEHERLDRVRKIAEIEIENSKRYQNLADAIPHIIWKARDDGVFYHFNRVWLKYTRLTQDQSLGMGWQKAVHHEDLGSLLKIWLAAMEISEPFETEVRLERYDRVMRWHLVRALPEFNSDGTVGWIGTCTDIHDKKLAEARLIEAERQAVSANLAKTSFLANMSHEIRTPMGSILGFSELLLQGGITDEKRAQCTEAIHRGGTQLLRLIDEILDISKVEAGRLEVEMVGFDLLSLLTDVFTAMEVQALDKHLHLEFSFATPTPERVYSDPTRLRQVLINMVGNAIKFTHAGGVTVKVSWGHDLLKFRVMDTGVGIDADNENVQNLFQPFVQMDSSTTRRFGGTGLGLYLSREIINALGGDITLEVAEEGWNTEFLISLHAKHAGPMRLIPPIRRRPAAREVAGRRSNADLTGVRVLLVEDLVDNQELMSMFLNGAGAQVDVAENGQVGVEMALGGAYDVVLMDMQMPVVDGYQATARLREANFTTPIIALTAHALKEERGRSLAAGCTDHLTKPIACAELINRVAEYARPGHDLSPAP